MIKMMLMRNGSDAALLLVVFEFRFLKIFTILTPCHETYSIKFLKQKLEPVVNL